MFNIVILEAKNSEVLQKIKLSSVFRLT